MWDSKFFGTEKRPFTNKVTILWDMPVQTNKEIKANRPDKVVKDKEKRTCLLIDMSIPNEKKTSLKTVEKLPKYKDLKIEIEKPWKLKQQLSQWSLVLSGLSRRGLKTTSERSHETSE